MRLKFGAVHSRLIVRKHIGKEGEDFGTSHKEFRGVTAPGTPNDVQYEYFKNIKICSTMYDRVTR